MPLAILLALFFQQKPSPEDSKFFLEEIHRVEELLDTANDKSTVLYALARTWAAGGEYREAMETLKKAAALNVGLDPTNDKIFEKLHTTTEYKALLTKIRADTPPI